MAGTSFPNSFDVKNILDYLKDKALAKQFNSIRDKHSLENFGAMINKNVAKFGVIRVGSEDIPTRTIFVGDNQSVSCTYSRNPNAEKCVMDVFEDAIKDCEDKEMIERFDMIVDYNSLEKYVCMFFDSVLGSGFLDDVEKKKMMLPAVAVHTYVIGIGLAVGNTSAALKAFQHMSASGVAPKPYTYTVLIKGLAADPNYCGDAKKFLLEMMDKGMRPNAAAYTSVIEGFVKQEDKAAEEEGKQLVEVMMHMGFVPNAKAMMEVLKGRPKPLIRKVIDIALSKLKD